MEGMVYWALWAVFSVLLALQSRNVVDELLRVGRVRLHVVLTLLLMLFLVVSLSLRASGMVH